MRAPGRAVVIGGSIAGVLAAAAAQRHFEEVLVFDRDDIPDGPVLRPGVPHGPQFHALLARGLAVMEDFFPGFTENATTRMGCHHVSVTKDIMNRRRYGWAPRIPSDVNVLLASRPMVEFMLRERVVALPGVELRPNVRVTGLEWNPHGVITGVRLEGAEEAVAADLVIDASGRASLAPEWFMALGFDAPEETQVDARWGYTSCFATEPEGADFGFDAISAMPLGAAGEGPGRTRGAALWRQEGRSRWIVTAIGSAGDRPPSDEEGLRAFLHSLPHPEVVATVDALELELPARSWRRTVNRLRHYERLTRRPEAFVLLGDAVAAFNPVYGQGMTVAALAALELDAELGIQRERHGEDGMHGLADRFQKRIMGPVQFCWDLATGADYRIEGVVGPPPAEDGAARSAFMDRVEALTSEDPELLVKYFETAQLLRSPAWLQDDDLRARVLKDWDRLGKMVGAAG